MESEEREGQEGPRKGSVWILVDHSAREAAFSPIAGALEEQGVGVELVTITEVLGSVAREALAGGAERILRGLRVAVKGRGGDEDFINAIRKQRPDVLVVTEPRFVRSIGVLENLTGVSSLQVGLISDFNVDPGWFAGQLHGFIVPDEKTSRVVVETGVPADRVQIAGPALKPSFHRSVDRDAVRSKLGFKEELNVLVRADGFDTATLEKLVFQCTLVERDIRFIFHHDSDGGTATALRRAADQYGLSAAMFGRVDDLERYVTASDAIIAADDDGYLPELIQAGAPLLFVHSSRGSRGNADALKAKGWADELEDVGHLGARLERFLESSKLEEKRAALASWNGVERSEALVGAIQEVVANSASWLKEPVKSQSSKPEAKESSSSPPAGPFETIGRSGEPEKKVSREDQRGDGAAEETKTAIQLPPASSSAESTTSREPRLNQAEARDELAKLILKERDLERQLEEISKQQDRWKGRLELAREWNEEDLASEAQEILKGYLEEARPLDSSLREIRAQKEKLKTAARGGPDSSNDSEPGGRARELENRFQKMEMDRDLEGLKDRIKRELGE